MIVGKESIPSKGNDFHAPDSGDVVELLRLRFDSLAAAQLRVSPKVDSSRLFSKTFSNKQFAVGLARSCFLRPVKATPQSRRELG
jgi:hypothetical protein